eukprot:11219035-Lingulodinium_polyedra.AAC.1
MARRPRPAARDAGAARARARRAERVWDASGCCASGKPRTPDRTRVLLYGWSAPTSRAGARPPSASPRLTLMSFASRRLGYARRTPRLRLRWRAAAGTT